MTALLTTAYWPSLHYFFYVLHAEKICIEQFENYQKQSYRNRCQVLAANGLLDLSIPIEKNAPRELTKDIRISYKENWQIRHWRAITSAYKNSPYFDYFEEEIFYFYERPFESLISYNTQQLQLILKLLKLKKEIAFSTAYEKQPANFKDLRSVIHPKTDFSNDALVKDLLAKPYYQTFENKFNFQPDLSMLDLLFNKGLEAIDYLKSSAGFSSH